MASSSIITVQGLGKKYDLARDQYSSTLRETLTDMLTFKGFRKFTGSGLLNSDESEFWALRNISFSIEPGEVFGILGKNGAGKSTLLKIISRIVAPTEGSVKIRGRVGSLLEVGTGFHPELTGRENVFMSGALLGMKRAEIEQKFKSIVEFSEVEQFLDIPVKRYSSGMYVRLAFAVVAHLDPDVLIVDEVLAVGDSTFQKKCMDKIREIVRNGSTILLVSHNINAVMALCTNALLLDKGSVVAYGDVFSCVNKYARTLESSLQHDWQGDIGDENIRLHRAHIIGDATQYIFNRGDTFNFEITYEVLTQKNSFVVVGVDICTPAGILLCANRLTDFTINTELAKIQECGKHVVSLEIDTSLFAEGEYLIKINLGLHNIKRIIEDEPMLSFTIVNPARNYDHETPMYRNMIYPDWKWYVQ